MWQIITALAGLVGTGVAILYTLETRKTRLQKLQPKLVFSIREHQAKFMEDSESVALFVRNMGEGNAFNVQIERGANEGFQFKFDPEHIAILETAEERQLTMRPAEGSHVPDITTILGDSSVGVKITATYFDVERRKFRTSTVVGGGAKPPFISEEPS